MVCHMRVYCSGTNFNFAPAFTSTVPRKAARRALETERVKGVNKNITIR